MITVEVPVPSANIGTPMNAMRAWLDEMHFEPSRFAWQETAEGVVVRVRFKVAEEALAFAEHFFGRWSGRKRNPAGERGAMSLWLSGLSLGVSARFGLAL
jgi:hypothetical protein